LNGDLAAAIVQCLFDLRDSRGVKLYCYCLMPDHLHVLLSPSERSGSLMQIMRAFKSYTTRMAWSFGRSGSLWARSFYDRAIRDEQDIRTTCEYILGNPVRAGLVEEPDDYPYAALLDYLPL
jgi:REP element-mobilizing transposase RayT